MFIILSNMNRKINLRIINKLQKSYKILIYPLSSRQALSSYIVTRLYRFTSIHIFAYLHCSSFPTFVIIYCFYVFFYAIFASSPHRKDLSFRKQLLFFSVVCFREIISFLQFIPLIKMLCFLLHTSFQRSSRH